MVQAASSVKSGEAPPAIRRGIPKLGPVIQFGYGQHRSLGEMFANSVLKTGWSLLLQKYQLTLLDEDPQPDWTKAVGTPFSARPLHIRCEPRQRV